MKILQILGSPQIGGIEKLALDFITACSKKKEITNGVLFVLGKDGPMLESFIQQKCEVVLGELSSGYDFNPGKLRKIAKLFSVYDILHIHTFNPFIAWLASKSGKKIIYTEHGNFGFGRKRKLLDFTKEEMLKHFLHTKVDHCIYNSQFTKVIADERYGLLENKGSVIHNGVLIIDPKDIIRMKRYGSIEFEGKYIIGTISRFAGFKRIDRLVRAFSLFQENKKDVLLLLVGDGPLAPILYKLVKELGIVDKVVFTGYQTNPLAWHKTMNICVFPSNNEPFGLVAIEAMSMGKPVIVFKDGGGFVETVGHYCTNDIVQTENDMVNRIQFYYDQGQRDQIDDSRVKWAKQYSIERIVEKIIGVYRTI